MENVLLEGFEELYAKLANLAGPGAKETARKGIEKASNRIKEAAIRTAPVDSGSLKNSITSKTEISGDEVIGTVEAGANHAFFVEYGTGSKALPVKDGYGPIDPDTNVPHRQTGWTYYHKGRQKFYFTMGYPARPFMYPAYINNRDACINDIIDEFIGEVQGIIGAQSADNEGV